MVYKCVFGLGLNVFCYHHLKRYYKIAVIYSYVNDRATLLQNHCLLVKSQSMPLLLYHFHWSGFETENNLYYAAQCNDFVWSKIHFARWICWSLFCMFTEGTSTSEFLILEVGDGLRLSWTNSWHNRDAIHSRERNRSVSVALRIPKDASYASGHGVMYSVLVWVTTDQI